MSTAYIQNLMKEFLQNIFSTPENASTTAPTYKPNTFVNRTLIVIAIIFVLSWYVKYLWKRRFLYIHSLNVPGPFALPFVGSAHLFLSSKTTDIMEALLNVQKQYPDLARAWFGPKLYYFVSRPEHIEKILTSTKAIDKDYLYKYITYVIGEGLITARGKKWKKHRKVIMPAFNQKMLDNYQQIFAQKAEIFADVLEKEIGNKNLDLFHYVSNCTLDIICETAMGLDMNIQKSNSDFGKNLDKIMEITTFRIFKIWHHLDFTWDWYPISKEYARVTNNFKSFTGTVIKKKLEAHNNRKDGKNPLVADDNEGNPKKVLAFLDLILENSNFTEEELKEEVNMFMIAGTDTTASALCCAFIMLGMFPEVQQKVYEEVMRIVGPDRRVLPSDLPEMRYMERVIKESLRLFPVAAFFLRKIAEDIKVDDMIFPKGSSAFFGCVHIHRNPKYWPDPLKFDPDRFLPENVAKRHPCTYIPFSYGPRNCIGGRYGMINMKTIIAVILRRYKIFTEYKSIEEIKLKVNIVLKLKDGTKVWVEAR